MKGIILFFFLITVSVFALAQGKEITGHVIDHNQTPLPGVTISVKGMNKGTLTDDHGAFAIMVPDKGSVLIVSMVGFDKKEVIVGSESVLEIILSTSENSLSEVVIIGFGSSIKKDITGNIAMVKGSDLVNIPVVNFTQALQGKAAGVFIESNSGKVGEAVKVRVRGTGSISASSEPLYVIDGIPVNSIPQSGPSLSGNATATPSGNPLADFNTFDIASIEILKDASAAAIYGSRAANGVVLITTKSGKSGKPELSVNFQYGFNTPTRHRQFLNGRQYVELLREAAINSDRINGIDPTNSDQYTNSLLEFAEKRLAQYSGGTDWRSGQTNTDWEKLAYNKNSITKNVNLSGSGGNEKTKFYISLGYNDQEGILFGNDFKRLSGRINFEHQFNTKLKIGINLGISKTISNRVAQDNQFSTPMQIAALAPITPVYDKNGQINDRPVTTYYNPLIELDNSRNVSNSYRNIGTSFLSYQLLKKLTFRTEFGFDIINQNDDVFHGIKTEAGQYVNGQGSSNWYRTVNYNVSNYFNYHAAIQSRQTLDLIVGSSFQDYKNDLNYVAGQDFPVDALKKIESAGKITEGSSAASESNFLSYFVRASYKHSDRYLLTLSGRADGSSRFGKDNRFGFFPAVSAGWVLSEEKFLIRSRTVSFLKVRASLGLTGNAEGFGDFKQLGLWGATKYGGASGLLPTQLANPDLKWEKSTQTDLGIDFGLYNNRLSGQIDLYLKNTRDLIYDVPIPGISGFATQTINVGSMLNKGVEFVITSINFTKRNFSWNTSFNLARNNNKIKKLDGKQNVIPTNDGRFFNALKVGEPIGIFYGPKFAGVDPANGDAMYYKSDGKITHDYNEAGNFVVGNPNPDWIGGITNSIRIKNVELSILFQGVFGNQIQNGAGPFMSSSFDWFDNQTIDQLKRWQKIGDITNVPQLRLSGGNGTGASSRYIYDASYLRLKNVTMAYNIPRSVLNKIQITSLRLFVTGVNLGMLTRYPGWDPEVNTDFRANNKNQGSDFYAAPQIRSFTFGINLIL